MGNQKLILANQLILFRYIDHDGIYFAISKGKTLFSDIASAIYISHPEMRTWKYNGRV